MAIPALEKAGVTYFDPQLGLGEWTENRQTIEMAAKDEALVLLFVINEETRGVATIGEVAYYLAQNRRLALVVRDVTESSLIEGRPLSAAERDDLNRGRIFIRTMALNHDVPVFATIEGAVQHAIQVVSESAREPLSRQDIEKILRDIEFRHGRFLCREIEGGFLIQLSCKEPDVRSGKEEVFLGRLWYIPNNSTASEVVRTTLKAVLTWQEHEAREQFKYRGVRLFSPHFDAERLVDCVKTAEQPSVD